MHLTEQGKIALNCWQKIPEHFPYMYLDEYTVMPNHIHGIIVIHDLSKHFHIDQNKIDDDFVETGHALSLQSSDTPPQSKQPHPRFRNQGKNTISSAVGSFKSAVTKYCNENNLQFGWQSRFHDHIIRNAMEFQRIKNYIINNVANWKSDKFFQ